MRMIRPLLVAVSAAALGGALMLSAVGSPGAASRQVTTHAKVHFTAKFLAEARAALLKQLRTPDTAMFPHGRPTPTAGVRNAMAAGSYNWAGYAATATTDGAFTAVSGSWVVPTLTCTGEDRITSDWVGLDGWTSSTVEQDGTVGQCFQNEPIYYSWYEMYPAGTVVVGTTVAPGDSISASVTRSGSSYTLALTDSTNTANSFTETATCATTTCLDTSAEWIAERPSYSTTGIVPEAIFSTLKFTNASLTAKGVTSTITGYDGIKYQITCVDSTDTYDIVTTSTLTGGNAFTNVWKGAY
jgi:hypothetical protein